MSTAIIFLGAIYLSAYYLKNSLELTEGVGSVEFVVGILEAIQGMVGYFYLLTAVVFACIVIVTSKERDITLSEAAKERLGLGISIFMAFGIGVLAWSLGVVLFDESFIQSTDVFPKIFAVFLLVLFMSPVVFMSPYRFIKSNAESMKSPKQGVGSASALLNALNKSEKQKEKD